MKKEFVPYEQALALKELGFDKLCIAHYRQGTTLVALGHGIAGLSYSDFKDEGQVLAPTFSQAFRWFREKYGLLSWIQNMGDLNPEGFTWYIQSIKGIVLNEYSEPKFKDWCMSFKSPEEAELACLIKLIEICRTQKSI